MSILKTYTGFEARPVKNEYDDTLTTEDANSDVDIAVIAETAGQSFQD